VTIEIHLRDLSSAMFHAWRREFDGVESVRISCGDIFSTKPGRVEPGDPIDVKADAIVSPANSFGFMDGGIDAVYTHVFGWGVQQRLQELLAREHGGELPVGSAVIVPTKHPDIPWCISAPTMRVPQNVARTVNAYLAFRAALRAVLAHNASGQPPIHSVLCPGLGTAVGQMPVARCARQMRVAWDRVLGDDPWTPHTIHLAGDDDLELLGCGAIKQLDATTGELKSMRTAAAHLRKGVAARILEHLLAVARARNYTRVSLETGSGQAFEPALALYRKYGFANGDAFGDYVATEFNQFLHLEL